MRPDMSAEKTSSMFIFSSLMSKRPSCAVMCAEKSTGGMAPAAENRSLASRGSMREGSAERENCACFNFSPNVAVESPWWKYAAAERRTSLAAVVSLTRSAISPLGLN